MQKWWEQLVIYAVSTILKAAVKNPTSLTGFESVLCEINQDTGAILVALNYQCPQATSGLGQAQSTLSAAS